ncbi:MAG: PEP-CTERM sorting domain-containing protein [Akkermansiaceae bacterium]|nr:PEP-CTERM sorting domain-containing protein [Akkermansiaceae bacterium]
MKSIAITAVSALLAGACASADTSTTTTTLGTNYTVTITFDPSSAFSTLTAGTAISEANCLTLLSISSSSNPIGAGTGYSSSENNITLSGIYGTSATAGSSPLGSYISNVSWVYTCYVNGVSQESDTTLGNAASAIDWTDISTAALTMTYSYTSGSSTLGTTFYLSYVDSTSGDVYTYVGYAAGLRYSSHSGTAINVDTDYASLVSYSTETASVSEAIALNTAALVPEPATATLSLLALAGLAVRRRRA